MSARRTTEPTIAVRSVRTIQAGKPVYAFFVAGADLLKIAEISRVHRDAEGTLQGFQRKGIKSHVQSITDFLDSGPVLFPNAIILAISERAKFTQSRGEKPSGDVRSCEAGTLRIPLPVDGSRAAWIVDGQQRSIALSHAKDSSFPVPVIAFVSEELSVHREQFILVNKAKPLDPRLINELLPEVDARFPRDLAARKVPSELVNLLQTAGDSPFRGLIKRPSEDHADAVVMDSALIKSIRGSLSNALGALAPYKATTETAPDIAAMYAIVSSFWAAARDAFPKAWGLPPTQSRLMHSAGIEAMGVLMDRLMSRATADDDLYTHAFRALKRIAPHCHWTSGRWPELQRDWNEIQNTGRDIKLLSTHLARLDHQLSFAKVA